MSTRTHIASLTSLDPIRNAIGSNDETLVKNIMERYAVELKDEYDGEEPDEDELEEFKEDVESMVMCPEPPNEEPGCWNYVVPLLAAHYGLAYEDDYSFNFGWKHLYVWDIYRNMLAGHITPEIDASLQHIEDGRPFQGSQIDPDGCVFGWLTPDEVTILYKALSQIDNALITDEDMIDFHTTWVETLKAIHDRNAVLFMSAH